MGTCATTSRCYELPQLDPMPLDAAGNVTVMQPVCPPRERLDLLPLPTLDGFGELIVCPPEGGSQGCPVNSTCCFMGENPADGKYRFDNAVWASLLVLQGLTVDGWNEVCYTLMDALGWPVLLWYALVVFFGAFFVMQLLSVGMRSRL